MKIVLQFWPCPIWNGTSGLRCLVNCDIIMTGAEKREIWRPQSCSHSFSCWWTRSWQRVRQTTRNRQKTKTREPRLISGMIIISELAEEVPIGRLWGEAPAGRGWTRNVEDKDEVINSAVQSDAAGSELAFAAMEVSSKQRTHLRVAENGTRNTCSRVNPEHVQGGWGKGKLLSKMWRIA